MVGDRKALVYVVGNVTVTKRNTLLKKGFPARETAGYKCLKRIGDSERQGGMKRKRCRIFWKQGVILSKKKLNKAQRREQRKRKARQWIVTYKGTPKKIVKHYKECFHVDTVCALKELQEIGVEFTQEYLDAVKRSEEERLRQKRMERQRKEQEKMELMYDDCDDDFAVIAGYTDGGAALWHDLRLALTRSFRLTRKSGSIWR